MAKEAKPEKIRRKPGVLERYVDLLYRRRIRSMMAIFRLKRHMGVQEFRFLIEEDRRSSIVIAMTFFVLGLVFAYILLRIVFNIEIAKADEPSKRAFVVGDSQAFLLMQDMPKLAPPGWTISGAPTLGSSVISWGERRP